MSEPTQPERDAEARTQHDPVLFGADPFARQPGEPQPDGHADTELPRPRWPIVVLILLVVVVMVGAAGIWVL